MKFSSVECVCVCVCEGERERERERESGGDDLHCDAAAVSVSWGLFLSVSLILLNVLSSATAVTMPTRKFPLH